MQIPGSRIPRIDVLANLNKPIGLWEVFGILIFQPKILSFSTLGSTDLLGVQHLLRCKAK